MRLLVVLSCAIACALAKPGYLGAPSVFSYSSLAASPLTVSSVAAPLTVSAVAAPLAAPAVAAPLTLSTVAAPLTVSSVAAPLTVSAVAPAVAVGVRSQYHAQDELGQASYGHAEPLQVHNAVQDAYGNKIGSYSYVAPDGQLIKTHYVADALGVRIASNALPVGPSEPAGPLPVAPEDTAEVVAARAAHLAEVETVKSRTKRGVLAHTATALTYAASPVIHATRIADVTTPVAAPVAAPLAVAAHHVAAPLAYASPLPVAAHHVAAPLAYAAAAPVAYSSPLTYAAAAPLVREATLTTVVNNPGHAVSYRVD